MGSDGAFNVSLRTSAPNGATTASIIAEWKACEVCSRRLAMPADSSAAAKVSMSGVGPDTTLASGEFSAASDKPGGQTRDRRPRPARAPTTWSPAGCACMRRPRVATSAQRIGERHDTGKHRGDELADAVTDEQHGFEAARQPDLREAVFDDEGGRLRDRRRGKRLPACLRRSRA